MVYLYLEVISQIIYNKIIYCLCLWNEPEVTAVFPQVRGWSHGVPTALDLSQCAPQQCWCTCTSRILHAGDGLLKRYLVYFNPPKIHVASIEEVKLLPILQCNRLTHIIGRDQPIVTHWKIHVERIEVLKLLTSNATSCQAGVHSRCNGARIVPPQPTYCNELWPL